MGEVYYYFQIYVHKPDTYIGTTWGLLECFAFLVRKKHTWILRSVLSKVNKMIFTKNFGVNSKLCIIEKYSETTHFKGSLYKKLYLNIMAYINIMLEFNSAFPKLITK